jgi:hypothetical protein
MEYYNKEDKKSVVAFFAIVGILLVSTLLSFTDVKIGTDAANRLEVDLGKKEPFSANVLKNELVKVGIKEHTIVYNQALLETGNFKSDYFNNRFNLFGFRSKNGYMKFDSWKDCVGYYKTWQVKRYKGGDYYKFLTKVGYAEDTLYIKKLKKYGI